MNRSWPAPRARRIVPGMRRLALLLPLALLAVTTVALAGSATASTASILRPFESPSGNLKCEGYRINGKYGLRCDVYKHSWKAPRQTKACDAGDYGSSLSMSGYGRVVWPCVSDATERGPKLAYGRTWRFGPFRCTSRLTGLTCRNGAHHGWFLSKGAYHVV